MTIATFCRSLLLEHGPLTTADLAVRAVAAGKTRSQQPEAAVKSAISRTEVLLPDGRWATPMWLLEGRVLTTRRLGRDSWFSDGPDVPADLDQHDFALLYRALAGGPIPLADGGLLRSNSYAASWKAPADWPSVSPGRGELLGLRVCDGLLHAEVVARTPELRRRGIDFSETMPILTRAQRYGWRDEVTRVSEAVTEMLVSRMVEEPLLLRAPLPPLTECIPALHQALRERAVRRREEDRHWRISLDLPAGQQWIAVEEAQRDGMVVDAWLSTFVSQALFELVGTNEEYGEFLSFGPR